MSSKKTKLIRIEGHIGFTVNLGNFESARVDFTEVRELEPDTTRDEAYAELKESLEAQMIETLAEAKQIKQIKKNEEESI